MEDTKKANFFNITKDKNESFKTFLTKLIEIWDKSEYSNTSTTTILKDKILDNVHNEELRKQIVAAKDVDMPKFLALCLSFDSFDGKKNEQQKPEDSKIMETNQPKSFFLPISEVVMTFMPV